MPRNYPNFDLEKETDEAIPAAIRVKQEILDMRKSAIVALGDVMLRRSHGRPAEKHVQAFQSNVIGLYSLVSMNFPRRKKGSKAKKEDIHDILGGFIRTGKLRQTIKWQVLYDCFCQLEKKIYDIGITKIVIKKTPGEQVF